MGGNVGYSSKFSIVSHSRSQHGRERLSRVVIGNSGKFLTLRPSLLSCEKEEIAHNRKKSQWNYIGIGMKIVTIQ